MFDWGLWFGGGFGCLVMLFITKFSLFGAMAAMVFAPGIAQLAGHRWAWHAGIASYCIMGMCIAFLRLHKPLSFLTVGMLLGCLWAIWQHWSERDEIDERLRRSNEDQPSSGTDNSNEDRDKMEKDVSGNSLVLWLKGPRFLDAAILSRFAERAFGVSFDESDDAEGFVVGKETHYILRLRELWFILHYREANYFDDPAEAGKGMRELRRLNAILHHEAWLSMDYLRGPADADQDKIMSTISTMIFELAGEGDVLALHHPRTGRIAPWSDEMRGFVTAEDPESAFAPKLVPVIRVSGDSAEMAAAVAEARANWPEFLTAFQSSTTKEMFSVKAPVTEGGNTEFIWISVRAISNGQIHGMLANDPVALGDLKIGDFVSVAEADVNDWCYASPSGEGSPRGLFTVKALG